MSAVPPALATKTSSRPSLIIIEPMYNMLNQHNQPFLQPNLRTCTNRGATGFFFSTVPRASFSQKISLFRQHLTYSGYIRDTMTTGNAVCQISGVIRGATHSYSFASGHLEREERNERFPKLELAKLLVGPQSVSYPCQGIQQHGCAYQALRELIASVLVRS